MEICTVIAKNYVAFARVLARSLAGHNPGSRLWTLIIDDFERYIDPAAEPFEVLTPADIGCEPFQFMALRYSVLELATAVKPWLLRHLMAQTGAPVTYLDPDIRVYGSLGELDELAAAHGIVVTPHTIEPVPPDGRNPSQVDIMIAGVYNLGYLSVGPGPEVDRLLDWWSERLRRDCRVDPVWGYFVDQRWFDLVPGFLPDLAIVRDPQYNVAYWNLHGRRLEHNGDRYVLDGHPLAFFHFSGFDPRRPLSLSRHQNRIDVTAEPVLERLLAEYAHEVIGEGFLTSVEWPYTYTALGDGTEIDDLVRSLFAEFDDELEQRGEDPLSPFTPAGAKTFLSWMSEDAPGAPAGINRGLARVYADRRDLQAAFGDLSGSGRDGLLRWAEEFGRYEFPLLEKIDGLRPRGRKSASKARTGPLTDFPWGVNVVACFGSSGERDTIARRLVTAFDAAGLPCAPIQHRSAPTAEASETFPAMAAVEAPYQINLICSVPDGLGEFAVEAGDAFFAGRYSIALWLTADVSAAVDVAPLLQEIWAPSAYVASLLRPRVTVPVHVIPPPVEPGPFGALDRSNLGVSEHAFLFAHTFEDLERQNPIAVIDAFGHAFEGGGTARLVVAQLGSRNGQKLGALHAAAFQHEGVIVLDGPLTRSELLGLISACDCYVSLHRTEAFGLSIAEAMWLAKPVIATAASANLEFMAPENSWLVEPHVEAGAEAMRKVFDDPSCARVRGARAAADLRRGHSSMTSAQAVIRRLESIRVTGEVPLPLGHGRRAPTGLAAVLEMPVGPRKGSAYRLRRLMRSAILRALRPYTDYQRKVNLALAELVGGPPHGRSLERAQMLAEIRGARQLRKAVEVQARALDEIRKHARLESDRALYLALAELARRHRVVGSDPAVEAAPSALTGLELRGYSQNGEDGVLAEILRRIGAPSRFFVEFGVESGAEGNCVYLADVAGWDGLFMEADDRMFSALARKYQARPGIRTIQALVTAENIETLLTEAEVPEEPDVMSIDVDGQDYWIFEALEQYRPRVVVIEYNSALDPHRRLVQPRDLTAWDGTAYFGASLGAIRQLAEGKGYRLVHAELAGVNAFLVREELAAGRFPAPDAVILRGAPNYYQTGYHHPADAQNRRYLDLDSGEMVPASR